MMPGLDAGQFWDAMDPDLRAETWEAAGWTREYYVETKEGKKYERAVAEFLRRFGKRPPSDVSEVR